MPVREDSNPPRRRRARPRRQASESSKRWIVGLVMLIAGFLIGTGGLIWALKSKKRSIPEQPGPQADHTAAPTELSQVVADLDRREPGWRLEELEARRKVLPAEQNSVLPILASRRRFEPRDLALGLQDTILNQPRAVQFDAQQTAALGAAWQKLQPALGEARKVADLPHGRYQITYARDGLSTLLPHAEQARHVAGLLLLDAAVSAQEGKAERAVVSCQAVLNVGRSLWDEPITLSQLVRISCQELAVKSLERALAQGEPSEEFLTEVQRLLEDEASQSLLLIMARGERAVWHAALTALQNGEVKLADLHKLTNGDRGPGPPPAVGEADLKPAHAWLLGHLTRLIEIAQSPPHEQQRQIDQWQKAAAEAPPQARVLLVAAPKLLRSCHRGQARVACAAAALAVERYRRSHGRWPDSLEALVPEKLTRVPTDPYDGQPLRYGRHAEGVVVYTVGPDLQDNGGTIDDKTPDRTGADPGFRLWDVPRRRQPAP